jgi:hypothetical protein
MIRTRLPHMTYRLILRVHPSPFRDRFAKEMLWIFDEECQRGATARLLLDGAVSAVRQHAKQQDEVDGVRTAFASGMATNAIGVRRIVQGGVMASILLYCFMLLLGQSGRMSVRTQASDHSCSSALRVPSHIRYPPRPPQNARGR